MPSWFQSYFILPKLDDGQTHRQATDNSIFYISMSEDRRVNLLRLSDVQFYMSTSDTKEAENRVKLLSLSDVQIYRAHPTMDYPLA